MHTSAKKHSVRSNLVLTAAAAASLLLGVHRAGAAIQNTLLNDVWADGDRTNTALPTDSADFVGIASGNGSITASSGKLAFAWTSTSNQKLWTYFTNDNSAPDNSVAHNAVTTLAPGDKLKASITFTMPNAIAATNNKNFRVGLFNDPTDARVQLDVNSDSGGGTNPWQDATGYLLQIPISTASGTNPIQLGKRTQTNTSLAGATGAYTQATTGGAAYSMAPNTSYTIEMIFDEVSASQLDVTASIIRTSDAAVLATVTRSDTGTTFGGTAVGASPITGANSIYNKFDQLFFRISDNTQTTEYDFTNFKIELPEPGAATMLALVAGVMGMKRRRAGR